MIATHNIKVNGVWYKVGEEIVEVSSPILENTTTSEDDDLFAEEKPKRSTKKSK